MRIKNQVPRGLRNNQHKSRQYHYWLVDKPPRRKGRLAQLQKRNTRMRLGSRVTMEDA